LWLRWTSSALMPPALLTSQLIDLKLEDKRACSFTQALCFKLLTHRAGPVPRQAVLPAMLCNAGDAFCHPFFHARFRCHHRDALRFLRSLRCALGSVARRCALRGKYLCLSNVGDYARGRRITSGSPQSSFTSDRSHTYSRISASSSRSVAGTV